MTPQAEATVSVGHLSVGFMSLPWEFTFALMLDQATSWTFLLRQWVLPLTPEFIRFEAYSPIPSRRPNLGSKRSPGGLDEGRAAACPIATVDGLADATINRI